MISFYKHPLPTKRTQRALFFSTLFVLMLSPFIRLTGQVSDYVFYQFGDTYTPITGTLVDQFSGPTGVPSLDNNIYNLPDGTIPFPFEFDGNVYTGLNISTNGFITFGATSPTGTNFTPLSNLAAYSGAISAFGRDLQGGWTFTATRVTGSNVLTDVSDLGPLQIGDFISALGFPAGTVITDIGPGTITVNNNATSNATNYALLGGGPWSNIQYATVGTEPERSFVIQWSGFKRLGTTMTTAGHMSLNFQIRLNEIDNSVEIVYNNCSPGVTTFATVNQVGLRGPNNTFPANVNNRLNVKDFNDNWLGSNPGTANTSGMIFNNVEPANVIPDGLTYRWVLEDCAGVPDPGNTIASETNVCTTGSVSLSLENDTEGLGVTYQWQSSPDGNDPWTDFGTGGDSETAFVTEDTYFRCIVTCDGQDGISTPVLVTTFYEPCQCDPNPLCVAAATNLTSEHITNVTFAGINNSTGATGYGDYRCLQGLVNMGDSYQINVDVTNPTATQWTETVRVYIDWNQNFVFEPDEVYDLGIIPVPGFSTLTFPGTIDVPLDALPGITHVRVINRFSSYHNLDGCGTFGFGEVEDYWLEVTDEIPPVANFSVNDPLACVGQCLDFTDLSLNDVDSYLWVFPGSSTAFSVAQNPTGICFTSPGIHLVSLTVDNQWGSGTIELPVEVIVCGNPGCTYPDAVNFNASATVDDGSCDFDCPDACPGDLNSDGIINFSDLTIFLSLFGGVCP